MPLGSRFDEALLLASALHREQRRKASGTPYIAHLVSVAALVIESGGDEEEAIAALLHDAVEDQGGAETREEIRRRFGERVTAIVDGCTDTEIDPKPEWRRRKEMHRERLRAAPPEVLRVIAADKLHNLRTLVADYRRQGADVWRCFTGGREGTLWYYRAMLETIRAGAPPFLVAELDRTVADLVTLVTAAEPDVRLDPVDTI